MSTDFSRRDAQNEERSEELSDVLSATEVVSDDLELPGVAPILDGDDGASAVAADATHAVAGTGLTDLPPVAESPALAEDSVSAASSSAAGEGAGHRAVRRSVSRRDETQSTAVQRRSLFAQAGAVDDVVASDSDGGHEASEAASGASSSGTAGSSDAAGAHAGSSSVSATLPYPAATSGASVASPADVGAPSAPSATSAPRAEESAAAGDGEFVSRGVSEAAQPALEESVDAGALDGRREGSSDAEEPMAPVWHRRTSGLRSEDDILLEGSVVVGRPASRAAAHWASLLLCLVLLPLAWFFLHQSSHTLLSGAQAFHFDTDVRGLVSLGVGVVCALIALWTARQSSLGPCVIGVLVTIAGIPTLVAPGPVGEAVTPVLTRLSEQSSLGGTVASMCWSDAVTGRLLAAGLFLLMMGVVSHSARRAGRHEQEVIDRVRRVRES